MSAHSQAEHHTHDGFMLNLKYVLLLLCSCLLVDLEKVEDMEAEQSTHPDSVIVIVPCGFVSSFLTAVMDATRRDQIIPAASQGRFFSAQMSTLLIISLGRSS